MTFFRLTYSMLILAAGLGVGVFWSPMGGYSQLPAKSQQDTAPDQTGSDMLSDAESAKMRKKYEEINEKFLQQFKDLNIHIKKHPLNISASDDGRFTIAFLKNNEMIASELHHPRLNGEPELVRHYDFLCGDIAYHCDFARSSEDAKIHNAVLGVENKGKSKYVYVDTDGDGLWDRFDDFTQDPPQTYKREGPGWSWKEKNPPKADLKAHQGET